MRFFVANLSRYYPASRVIGLIVAILVAMVILGLSARAEETVGTMDVPMAQSVGAPVVSPPEEPKGERVEWSWVYVSGVSENIITVIVPIRGRRSYEPVEITSATKITQGGRSASLKNIRIWQRVSVRGVRNGDIVQATEFLIGGTFPRVTATKKKTVTPSVKPKSAAASKVLPKKSKNIAPKTVKKAVSPPKKPTSKTKVTPKKK